MSFLTPNTAHSAVSPADDRATIGHTVAIYDMESRLPVGHVVVTIMADSTTMMRRDTTGYNGQCLLPDSFYSIIFEKKGYSHEMLYRREVGDTMWLSPEGVRLNEVIIDGHHRPNTERLKHNVPYTDPLHKAKHKVMEFDFANMIDFRGRRDRKHLRKARKLMRNYELEGILIPKQDTPDSATVR